MTEKKLQLLDIFSYSCMNCLRSLECIKQLDSRYRKHGLETIIIHPPEWAFDKDSRNILQALKDHGIKIPIVIDKDKKIIKRLKVDFWPTQILVKGRKIAYRHVGEGNYKTLEKKIANILGISSERIFKKEPMYSKLPTIYAGKKKHGIISKKPTAKPGMIYADNCKIKDEYIEARGKVEIMAMGKKANFVAESGRPVKARISIDGKFKKTISINKPGLYRIADCKGKITIEAKSLRIYSFSFE